MPPGKDRTKDDTWKEDELKRALQGEKKKSRDDRKSKEGSSRRDDERKERRDRDDDKRRRERHKEIANGESGHGDREKERRKRDDPGRERTRDRERDRDRDRDRDKDKPRDKDREKRREREGDRDKSRDQERERRREKDHGEAERSRDKEKERRRERDGDVDRSKDKDRERRRETESKERDKRREKHGEGSKEKERRREKDGDRERSREHSSDKRKDRERRRDEDNDHGREKSRGRERDKDRDRDKERSKDGEREREDRRRKERREEEGKDSDREERRRHRRERESRDKRDREDQGPERDDHRKSRSGKEASETRETVPSERVKRREKELMESLKKEEDLKSNKKRDAMKFRSDTVEEADTVEEEENKQRRKSSVAIADEVNDEDPGGNDYEDDFEDYEEDFENDEEEENSGEDEASPNEASPNVQDKAGLQELLQAINAENEDVNSFSREGSSRNLKNSHEDSSDSRQERSSRPTTSKSRINFFAAKQKQINEKVASRTKKRGQELMHLIDLDVAAFDIFELPPLGEYELYIKNFGRSDTKQAYVQCNEDNVEKEVQTEDIEYKTMWTQEPALGIAAGGDEEQEGDLSSMTERASIDSLRLSKFLDRAGQTCLQLLEESSDNVNTMFREKREMSCSDGFIKLTTEQPFLEGRTVQCVHVSPVQTHLLMTAYGPVEHKSKATSKVGKDIQSRSVICVWNINEPSTPQKVLLCESVPKCCSFSPSKATLAFAGLADGSLVAWDLREQSSLHRSTQVEDTDAEFRNPTFSTAGILREESHHSPVKSLLPIVVPGDRQILQEISAASVKASGGTGILSDDMLGLSFQLASLEENGIINIWVVVELDRIDVSGSESDLGLAPGGRVKLIKSASLTLESPYRDFRKTTKIQAFAMCFLPQDPNHIYVGTDGGYVLHCVRHGGRSPPKAYRPSVECLVDVQTLDVSPWHLPCILAGSKDGSLRLYNLKNETPLNTWSEFAGGSSIVCTEWSRSRPSVFYVLDSNSRLHVWDLLVSDSEPVAVERFKHGRVTHFELSSDYSASGVGLPGRSPEMVLVYDSGTVEVHKISTRFANTSADELDRFASYLDSVLS